MKALSLWQPWASLWLTSRKIHETRSWKTSYRGPLAVHAAKRPIDILPQDNLDYICAAEFGSDWREKLPRGALIGEVDLVDVIPTEELQWPGGDLPDDYYCGDFSPGRFAWRRCHYIRYEKPIPYRGAQQIFEIRKDQLHGR